MGFIYTVVQGDEVARERNRVAEVRRRHERAEPDPFRDGGGGGQGRDGAVPGLVVLGRLIVFHLILPKFTLEGADGDAQTLSGSRALAAGLL